MCMCGAQCNRHLLKIDFPHVLYSYAVKSMQGCARRRCLSFARCIDYATHTQFLSIVQVPLILFQFMGKLCFESLPFFWPKTTFQLIQLTQLKSLNTHSTIE